MRITPDQEDVLKSFKCIRLSKSEDKDIIRIVDNFSNPRNENLENFIKNEAFDHDRLGKVACYVIIDDDKDILCYFALKSGLLFQGFKEWYDLENYKKIKAYLFKSNDSVKPEILKKKIRTLSKKIKQSRESVRRRLGAFIDGFSVHKPVSLSFPAIELSHFCVNEDYRGKWKNLGLGERNRIGLTLFWHYIFQKILDASDVIGSEYVYLFAADCSGDRFLVNHYKDFMGFREDLDVLAIQPIYDISCTFLCNTIEALKESKNKFFDSFNEDISLDV